MTTNEQAQPGPVVSLESACMEFSSAFSLTIVKLVADKLELKERNQQLAAYIEKQKATIEQLEREINLVKSRPKD